MRCWYFSEMAYHPAWEAGLSRGTLRVVLPSSNFDPPTAHGLLNATSTSSRCAMRSGSTSW